MNVKNNRRRRESVEKIEKAFIGLLQTKDLHTITVSDICSTAELNRSTFYANFMDIYDLADKIRRNLEDDFQELFRGEANPMARAHNAVRMFRHIRDNQSLYQTYFKLGYDNKHEFLHYNLTQAMQYFDNRHIDYHIEFFRNGLNAIIKLWLQRGCPETPEEMAEIIQTEYQGR